MDELRRGKSLCENVLATAARLINDLQHVNKQLSMIGDQRQVKHDCSATHRLTTVIDLPDEVLRALCSRLEAAADVCSLSEVRFLF